MSRVSRTALLVSIGIAALFVMSPGGIWERLPQGENASGVDTADIYLFGIQYEGYLWANVTGVALFGIAGFTNKGPPTPDDLYDELRALIVQFRSPDMLNSGRANSLLQKVDASQNRWHERPGSMAATNILEALINEVASIVKSHKLTQAQGDLLIMKANEIISAIQPSSR